MPQFKNLLVPGGLGFIGSNTVIQILQNTSLKCIIIDDLSNCYPDVLSRIKHIVSQKISSEQFDKRVQFIQANILNIQKLDSIFKEHRQRGQPIEGIMHFAAFKAVGQSMQNPILYYENNVVGSMNLLKMMEKYEECKNFIFSSTAAIYGDTDDCAENDLKTPLSPYGQSKLVVEWLLASLARVHKDWKIISLRYFNPCGAHKSGLLGDEPWVYPNNLFTFIQQLIMGKRQKLSVFGNDYPTPDGTGVRDFIHINDLANGHLFALRKLSQMPKNYDVFNLGSGSGTSVLQVIKGYEQVLGKPLNWGFAQRRPGDIPKLVAEVHKVNREWGWKTQKSLKDICADSVNFVHNRLMKKE